MLSMALGAGNTEAGKTDPAPALVGLTTQQGPRHKAAESFQMVGSTILIIGQGI